MTSKFSKRILHYHTCDMKMPLFVIRYSSNASGFRMALQNQITDGMISISNGREKAVL